MEKIYIRIRRHGIFFHVIHLYKLIQRERGQVFRCVLNGISGGGAAIANSLHSDLRHRKRERERL